MFRQNDGQWEALRHHESKETLMSVRHSGRSEEESKRPGHCGMYALSSHWGGSCHVHSLSVHDCSWLFMTVHDCSWLQKMQVEHIHASNAKKKKYQMLWFKYNSLLLTSNSYPMKSPFIPRSIQRCCSAMVQPGFNLEWLKRNTLTFDFCFVCLVNKNIIILTGYHNILNCTIFQTVSVWWVLYCTWSVPFQKYTDFRCKSF